MSTENIYKMGMSDNLENCLKNYITSLDKPWYKLLYVLNSENDNNIKYLEKKMLGRTKHLTDENLSGDSELRYIENLEEFRDIVKDVLRDVIYEEIINPITHPNIILTYHELEELLNNNLVSNDVF